MPGSQLDFDRLPKRILESKSKLIWDCSIYSLLYLSFAIIITISKSIVTLVHDFSIYSSYT